MTFEHAAGTAYIFPMKAVSAIALSLCLSLPAAAQEEGEGKSLMEQGAELFFEGLRKEMAPSLESLQGFAEELGPSMLAFIEEMGPALAELAATVQDWSAYHAPEMLPNGDIIIRKKTKEDAPEATPPQQMPQPPEIEGTDI